MTERPINELLSRLPDRVDPEPDFEVRLRAVLTAELRAAASGSETTATPDRPTTTEVLELETTTTKTTITKGPERPSSSRWRLAAAAAAVIVIAAVATAIALPGDDEPTTVSGPDAPYVAPTTTVYAPDATFVGATIASTPIPDGSNPYFIGALDDAWSLSLAGDLVHIDGGSGEILGPPTQVPEASPLAVDGDAVWVLDAVDGNVLRLDPTTGEVVATIETGIEVLPTTIRIPMAEGASRQFALVGGIVADGASVWVGDRAGQVLRIDPSTNEIADTFDVSVLPDHLRVEGDRLLVADLFGGEVLVVDTADGEVVESFEGYEQLAGAAIFGGAVYLQDATDGTVTRIDLETGDERTSEPLGASVDPLGQPVLPTALVVTSSGVLVDTDTEPDSLHILDPVSLESRGSLPVDAGYGDMTVAADGSVWLVRSQATTVLHIVPRPL